MLIRSSDTSSPLTPLPSGVRRGRGSRRGATMLEAAIVLPVFILLVFTMIDLGLGFFHYNMLPQAARHGVRQAIVHGKFAPPSWNGGPWGPATIDTTADASGVPIVDAVKPRLVNCDLSKTHIKVEWLDGSNDVEKNVRVTVTSTYQPIFASFIGGNIDLTGSATM